MGWFRSFAVKDKYQSAVLISGLVTFIAAYHYIRIFNSWVESYEYTAGTPDKYGALFIQAPKLTGVPFNDAYRYMDWLLTVPLLLIEILLVMKLPDDVFSKKAKTLGLGSAGPSPCAFSCTWCTSSLSALLLPLPRSRILLSRPRSSRLRCGRSSAGAHTQSSI